MLEFFTWGHTCTEPHHKLISEQGSSNIQVTSIPLLAWHYFASVVLERALKGKLRGNLSPAKDSFWFWKTLQFLVELAKTSFFSKVNATSYYILDQLLPLKISLFTNDI